MKHIETDTDIRRRTDRRTCSTCEAAPASCEARHWLSGRWCCSTCAGDHDAEGGPSRAA